MRPYLSILVLIAIFNCGGCHATTSVNNSLKQSWANVGDDYSHLTRGSFAPDQHSTR